MKAFQVLPAIAITLLISSTYSHADDKLIPIDYLNNYPSELQAEFDELKEMCKSAQYGDPVDFPLNVEPGFITRSDITGDGIDDYVVHTGKLACEYGASIWGNFPAFNVYQGMRNNDATLIYGSYSFSSDEENYPRVVSNDKGFFDLQYIGAGEDCGQEGNYSFAEMKACEITERWNKDTQDMDVISVKVLSYE